MTVTELIAIIIAAASLISSLSVIYGKLFKPIKKFMIDTEKNKEQIVDIKEDLKSVHKELKSQNDYSSENRAVVMESMIAILDGLEQNGANGKVTKTKKALITYMTKNLNGKK